MGSDGFTVTLSPVASALGTSVKTIAIARRSDSSLRCMDLIKFLPFSNPRETRPAVCADGLSAVYKVYPIRSL